jgi:hypothetical protein
MRVDSETLDCADVRHQRTFNGDARLPFVEKNRLVIDYRPSVTDMGVSADRGDPTPGLDAREPELARRIKAHHVRRSSNARAPMNRKGSGEHSRGHSVSDSAQMAVASIAQCQARRLSDLRHQAARSPLLGRRIAVIGEWHARRFPPQCIHDAGEIFAAGEQILVEPGSRRMRTDSLEQPR